MNKFLTIIFTLFVGFFVTTNSINAQECRIKQVPKMDLFIFIMGYKVNWETVENITKLSGCIKAAEENLAKANGTEVVTSVGDLVTRIIVSIFEPEYVKAIKVEYRDENNKLIKLKIKYQKPKA